MFIQWSVIFFQRIHSCIYTYVQVCELCITHANIYLCDKNTIIITYLCNKYIIIITHLCNKCVIIISYLCNKHVNSLIFSTKDFIESCDSKSQNLRAGHIFNLKDLMSSYNVDYFAQLQNYIKFHVMNSCLLLIHSQNCVK